jgi:hypothetical protein
MPGAGVAQRRLAAEMIGDGADIGLRLGGDLARRGGGEALVAEQLQPGGDERVPRLSGRWPGRRILFPVSPLHSPNLINRMIKVNLAALRN